MNTKENINNKKRNSPSSKGHLLLGQLWCSIFLIGTTISYSQTPNKPLSIQEALQERRNHSAPRQDNASSNPLNNINTAPVPNSPSSSMQKGQSGNAEPSLDSANKLYIQLIPFHYEPSQRDPFISYTVITPYVSENDLTEEVGIDQEKLKKAITDVTEFIKNKVRVSGISGGGMGVGYAIAKIKVSGDPKKGGAVPSNQIVRAGNYLAIPPDGNEIKIIEEVIAATGKKVKTWPKDHPSAVLIKIKKIDEKSIILETPGDKSTISVQFKRDLSDIPQVIPKF